MVLQPIGCGRVGHRHNTTKPEGRHRHTACRPSPFQHPPQATTRTKTPKPQPHRHRLPYQQRHQRRQWLRYQQRHRLRQWLRYQQHQWRCYRLRYQQRQWLCQWLRYQQRHERQRTTPTRRAIHECRMQFPQHRAAPRNPIVGIATLTHTIENSPNRIARKTTPSTLPASLPPHTRGLGLCASC